MGTTHLIARKTASVQLETLKELADALGQTAYEMRQALASGRGISLLRSGPGPFDQELGILRRGGVAAATVGEDELRSWAESPFLATEFDPDTWTVGRQDFRQTLAPDQIAWLVQGEWRSHPDAPPEGFLLMAVEGIVGSVLLRRTGFDFSVLGANQQVGSRDNFQAVVDRIRALLPHASFDDSLCEKTAYSSMRHLAERDGLMAAFAVAAVLAEADTAPPEVEAPPPAEAPWAGGPRPAEAVVSVAASTTTLPPANRHGLALEANSQILWGTSAAKVEAALQKRGATRSQARELVAVA